MVAAATNSEFMVPNLTQHYLKQLVSNKMHHSCSHASDNVKKCPDFYFPESFLFFLWHTQYKKSRACHVNEGRV